jgi:hypothetical protein
MLELESFRTCWTIEFTWVSCVVEPREVTSCEAITAIAAKL